MVYFDGIHLVADSLKELHAFAGELGLKRCWFHGARKNHPHYDVRGVYHWETMRKADNGEVKIINSKELVLIAQKLNNNKNG